MIGGPPLCVSKHLIKSIKESFKMTTIKIDASRTVGRIKPVHGVGQPPFIGTNYSYISYLKDANIPYSRLHDVGGAFGGNLYVDIPNLFRDFDADPTDPAAYDFTFTDLLISALVENGVEPFFRLGVTIENYCKIKPYRIFPPKDYHKWARICEGVIRHYTEGWAGGYHYDINYWEIWNEPDNYEEIDENQMWHGTKESFYELYHIAATYLKEQFPHLKIGGYASCGFYAVLGEEKSVAMALSTSRTGYFITFLDGFLDYIKERGTPLDFFSWHSYGVTEDNEKYAAYIRRRLDDAGYAHVEITCNEWNVKPEARGTLLHAANNTAALIAFQHAPLDSAMFYDARIGIGQYGGLFDPMTRKPYPLYYSFRSFGELYRMGNEVASQSDNGAVYVVAAGDGERVGILISNIGAETPLAPELGNVTLDTCRLIDEGHLYEVCDLPTRLPENSVLYLTGHIHS